MSCRLTNNHYSLSIVQRAGFRLCGPNTSQRHDIDSDSIRLFSLIWIPDFPYRRDTKKPFKLVSVSDRVNQVKGPDTPLSHLIYDSSEVFDLSQASSSRERRWGG